MAVSKIDTRIARLDEAGLGILRYGLVFLLVVIGATKFTPWEAAGIEPLVRNSPFLAWLPRALGLQGASDLIGTIEIATGLAIAARRLSPVVSAVGSLAAAGTFVTTLSFLFTTPGALSPMHPASAFLMKDVVLLGASLATAAEALRAVRARQAPRPAIATTSSSSARARAGAPSPTAWPGPASGSCSSSAGTSSGARRRTGIPPRWCSAGGTRRRRPGRPPGEDLHPHTTYAVGGKHQAVRRRALPDAPRGPRRGPAPRRAVPRLADLLRRSPTSRCIRCNTCDGFPCLVRAKSDAENPALTNHGERAAGGRPPGGAAGVRRASRARSARFRPAPHR